MLFCTRDTANKIGKQNTSRNAFSVDETPNQKQCHPMKCTMNFKFFRIFLRFGVFSLVAYSFIALVLGFFSSNFGKRFGFVGTSIKFSLEDNFLHHIIVSNSVENGNNG